MRRLDVFRRTWSIKTLCAIAPLILFDLHGGEAANGSVAYSYDALGRLITASYDTGVCIVYEYDANGNRTKETINVTTPGSTGVWGCFDWNTSGGANWGP